ncbi:hypothetical protein C8J56DRAFT_901388 [Mycena floridula]|nr:hypothetical protein C8J56DRAFT_901388 [Mycena floridula]
MAAPTESCIVRTSSQSLMELWELLQKDGLVFLPRFTTVDPAAITSISFICGDHVKPRHGHTSDTVFTMGSTGAPYDIEFVQSRNDPSPEWPLHNWQRERERLVSRAPMPRQWAVVPIGVVPGIYHGISDENPASYPFDTRDKYLYSHWSPDLDHAVERYLKLAAHFQLFFTVEGKRSLRLGTSLGPLENGCSTATSEESSDE